MPEIPQFAAQPVAIPEARRSFVSPAELAEPGRATERLGGQLEQLGDAFGRIRAMQDYQYVADQWSDATTHWHDQLQNGIDQARQNGSYQGFAGTLRQQLDQDLQQRLENAPSSMARSRLERHFATLTDQISSRASLAEHGMAVQDSEAKRLSSYDAFATQAYRDPTLATDLYTQGKAMSAGAAAAGLLNPEQQRREEKAFGDTLWTAHLLGRAERDPMGAMADLNAGKYDQYLDPKTLETLKPRLENATAKGLVAQMTPAMAAAGPSAPANPNASDADIDKALAPIVQRESGGNPNIGFGGADLSHAPLDATGFPIWSGNQGPAGISHAAGLYQIQPALWHEFAPQLGIHDFSPASQAAVARAAYRRYGDAPWAASGTATAPQGGLAAQFAKVDRMGLDPDVALKVKAGLRTNYDALEADQQRQQRLQLQAQRQASDAAENAVIADAKSDHPQITAQQIAADPALTPDAKLRMIQFVARDGQTDPMVSHQAAIRIMRGIGNGTVTDRTPLIDAFNQGQLNWSDFDHLSKQIDESRAGGEVFAKRKADFLKAIEPQIDKSSFTGVPDLGGKERFYQYQWLLDQQIDEYRQAGKNPQDLLDPSKPDYMGKPEALKPYQRSLSQLLHDLPSSADNPAAAGMPAASAPPAAIDHLRAHPELKAQFDAKYGAGAAAGILQPQAPLR